METIMCVLRWIWAAVSKPLHQSLILILLTVFVLGCQLALWANGTASVWTDIATVVLLVLYLLKNLAVLLKEIKEASTDGGNDIPPACSTQTALGPSDGS